MVEGMKVKVFIVEDMGSKIVISNDGKIVVEQNILDNKNSIEKITDFVGNIIPVELHKKSYSLLCKHKRNKCLIINKN